MRGNKSYALILYCSGTCPENLFASSGKWRRVRAKSLGKRVLLYLQWITSFYFNIQVNRWICWAQYWYFFFEEDEIRVSWFWKNFKYQNFSISAAVEKLSFNSWNLSKIWPPNFNLLENANYGSMAQQIHRFPWKLRAQLVIHCSCDNTFIFQACGFNFSWFPIG